MATPAIPTDVSLEGIPPLEPQPEPAGVETFGENNRKLPKQLQHAIAELFKELEQRDIYDRRIEVLKDRMHRFYDDGIQHVYPNYQTGMYQIGTPGGTVSVGDNQVECPDYMGAYNIFYPYRRSLCAVLDQNPPGIDFRPDDPSHSEDLEASETGEGYRVYFDQANDMKAVQQQISRLYCLSGRTVAWVFTDADKERWGENEEGQPRQMETVRIGGTLETKVPILAKDQYGCSYLFWYRDVDVLKAKSDFHWIKSKIKGGQSGIGENEWERFARLGVQQARKGYFLTGNAGAHITTIVDGFLRPETYTSGLFDEAYMPEMDEDPDFYQDGEARLNEDDEPYTLRDRMREIFPDGCHATFVGQSYAEAANEGFDDHLTISFPKDRDGMTGGALMQDLVVVQDEFNDLKNAEREAYEKGWPSLWIDCEEQEYDTIMRQRSQPFAIRQKKKRDAAGEMEHDFYREPDMELPESFVVCMENLRGPLAQFITGALPTLMGETDGQDKTASGKAMDRAQAMGMLGDPWANMQRLFARMYYQAALLAAKNPDHSKEIIVPSAGQGNVTLRLEKLTKGKFHCHPDTDSSFPDSIGAKRQLLTALVPMAASSPVGMELFNSPDNWETFNEINGMPELVFTPALAYKKQMREIELLAAEKPIPPEPEMVQQAMIQHAAAALIAKESGQPEPPAPNPMDMLKPSVPVQKEDYHKWEYSKCQEWLSSQECWRQIAEGNDAGVMNVRLHARQHEMFMMQQAMAQTAMAPPPAAKPPGHAPEAQGSVQKKSAPPGAPGQATQ